MLTWVESEGSTIKELRAEIERAEAKGMKELASMLRTILKIRLTNEK